MKLLDAELLINEQKAQLVEFHDERSLPQYAILSYTWTEEEVLFHDLGLGPRHEITSRSGHIRIAADHVCNGQASPVMERPHVKAGWDKILRACQQACNDDFKYIWIDTCCIDKSSSAELSEAINSMFRWYAKATVCYVYLGDCTVCPCLDHPNHSTEGHAEELLASHENCIIRSTVKQREDLQAQIIPSDWKVMHRLSACMVHQWAQSRWFTRGWTLQELIAPRNVEFFDRNWYHIATKENITEDLVNITGIHWEGLEGHVSQFSVAQRMYWASKRETTRLEDEAYCLMGIFDVNMPLLYGEGAKSFLRLQEEICKACHDHSIFAWELRPGVEGDLEYLHYLFAPSAAHFWGSARDIKRYGLGNTLEPATFNITSLGVELEVALDEWRRQYEFGINIAGLKCFVDGGNNSHSHTFIGLRLLSNLPGGSTYTGIQSEYISTIDQPMKEYKRLAYFGNSPDIGPDDLDRKYHSLTISRNLDVQGYSQPGFRYGNIFVRFKSHSPSQTEWNVISAHPYHQWSAANRTLTLPRPDGQVFAAIVIENPERFRCTVLFRISDYRNSWYLNYWIFPGPPTTYDQPHYSFGRHAYCLEHRYGLIKLCDDAKSFSGKDFFESSQRRTQARRFVLLQDGTRVSCKVAEKCLKTLLSSWTLEETLYLVEEHDPLPGRCKSLEATSHTVLPADQPGDYRLDRETDFWQPFKYTLW